MKPFLFPLLPALLAASLSAAEPTDAEKKLESSLGLGKPAAGALPPGMRMRGAATPAPQKLEPRAGFRLRGGSFTPRGGELPDGVNPTLVSPAPPESAAPVARVEAPPVKVTETLVQQAQVERITTSVVAESEAQLEDVLFDFNSTAFKDKVVAEANLRHLFNVLQRHPQARLLIEGHTCDVGDEHYNLVLSCYRADAVATALVRLGIAPERLETLGFGETDPVNKVRDSALPPAILESARGPNRRARLRLAAP